MRLRTIVIRLLSSDCDIRDTDWSIYALAYFKPKNPPKLLEGIVIKDINFRWFVLRVFNVFFKYDDKIVR